MGRGERRNAIFVRIPEHVKEYTDEKREKYGLCLTAYVSLILEHELDKLEK